MPTIEYLEELNNHAIRYTQHNRFVTDLESLEATATDFELTEVYRDEGNIIFRTPDSELINCWIDAIAPGIQDGGMGFDDQIDWYTDKGDHHEQA